MPPSSAHDFPPGATSERPKVIPLKKPNGGGAPTVTKIPIGESAFSLIERDLPDPVRLCDPWATEGVNLIAGKPKLGKTTIERQKLVAAAMGGQFLDSSFPKPVKCAFLSLEEGEYLARAKFKMGKFPDEALGSIQLHFDWPRGADGVNQLDDYLTANPDIKLVCIDSLTRFRSVPDIRANAFIEDYTAITMLHDLAKVHHGLCIDVIHHTRKAKSDDPMDDISGTYGLTAGCDSYIVLRYHQDGATMHIGGRLWARDENSYLIKKAENQRWEMVGPDGGLPDEQVETLRHVKASPVGMSGMTLAGILNISRQAAWQRLDLLVEKGFASKRMGKVYAK
jgi:hypothetical protein